MKKSRALKKAWNNWKEIRSRIEKLESEIKDDIESGFDAEESDIEELALLQGITWSKVLRDAWRIVNAHALASKINFDHFEIQAKVWENYGQTRIYLTEGKRNLGFIDLTSGVADWSQARFQEIN